MTTQRTAKQAYDENREKALQALAVVRNSLSKNMSDPNWANVGDVADMLETLQDLSDRVTKSGEYAE